MSILVVKDNKGEIKGLYNTYQEIERDFPDSITIEEVEADFPFDCQPKDYFKDIIFKNEFGSSPEKEIHFEELPQSISYAYIPNEKLLKKLKSYLLLRRANLRKKIIPNFSSLEVGENWYSFTLSDWVQDKKDRYEEPYRPIRYYSEPYHD